MFIATAVGAIVGDQISYWAGRLFGERLKTMWPLNRYPQLVAKGEDFVREHGGKSIAIGRFVPGVKSVVPGIVGMFNMNQMFFIFVNVTSGTFWAAAHVFPGILIGEGLAFAGELSGRLLVVLLVLLVLLALVGYAIRLAAAGVSPYLNHLLDRVSAWARRKPGRSWQRFARAVAPDNPRSVAIVLFAAIVFTGLIALANLGDSRRLGGCHLQHGHLDLHADARDAERARRRDHDRHHHAGRHAGDGGPGDHHHRLAHLAQGLSRRLCGGFRHCRGQAVRDRGEVRHPARAAHSNSPTRASMSSAFPLATPPWRPSSSAFSPCWSAIRWAAGAGRWSMPLCAVMVVAIAYSRVYLGAHWLSDVLAGLLFGTVMMAAFGVAIEAIPPRRIKPLGLFGAAFIVFIIAGAVHVSTGLHPRGGSLCQAAEPDPRADGRLGGQGLGEASRPPHRSCRQAEGSLHRAICG